MCLHAHFADEFPVLQEVPPHTKLSLPVHSFLRAFPAENAETHYIKKNTVYVWASELF